MTIKQIISGGQTGADQAALDVAIKCDLPHGGWILKGRLSENGPLPEKYDLQELPTAEYAMRTEKNVRDADWTLILSHGDLTGGSKLTQEFAEKHKKVSLYFDFNHTPEFETAMNQELDKRKQYRNPECSGVEGK